MEENNNGTDTNVGRIENRIENSIENSIEIETDIDYETISLRKRGKSIIKIGNARLGGTDVKIEVSTKFNWLQKKLWKYLLNIEIEDIKEDEQWEIVEKKI